MTAVVTTKSALASTSGIPTSPLANTTSSLPASPLASFFFSAKTQALANSSTAMPALPLATFHAFSGSGTDAMVVKSWLNSKPCPSHVNKCLVKAGTDIELLNAAAGSDAEEEALARSEVAHVFHIGDSQYEGTAIPHDKFPKIVSDVLSSGTCDHFIPEIDKKMLINAFKKALPQHFNPEETERAIKNGELVILATGHITHAVYVVIYKNCMAIINRGGKGKHALASNIEPFLINPRNLDDKIIKKIVACTSMKRDDALHYLYVELPLLLSPTNLPQRDTEFYENIYLRNSTLTKTVLQNQSVGNCAYTSCEGALLYSLMLLRRQENPASFVDHSQRTYMEFETCRQNLQLHVLQSYEKRHPNKQDGTYDLRLTQKARANFSDPNAAGRTYTWTLDTLEKTIETYAQHLLNRNGDHTTLAHYLYVRFKETWTTEQIHFAAQTAYNLVNYRSPEDEFSSFEKEQEKCRAFITTYAKTRNSIDSLDHILYYIALNNPPKAEVDHLRIILEAKFKIKMTNQQLQAETMNFICAALKL